VAGVFGGVLRINPDGTVPPDNPFTARAGADQRRYAYGLRNPFDITVDPVTGRVFATENGYIGQDAVIEVKPGANYGWPGTALSVPLREVEPPLLFFHGTKGPSGIEFYRGSALPALDGTLLFCQFHQGGALHQVHLREDGTARDTVIAAGCTSDVLTGPDGFVYFVDYLGGVVYRIARD
jgi:glucose/arabinose dehydrogenase